MLRWQVQNQDGPADFALRVAMSPDGRFVASVGGNVECWKFWDAASGVVCMTGARTEPRNLSTTCSACSVHPFSPTKSVGPYGSEYLLA